LSQQAEEIEDRIVIQAKFFERLTSDFFHRIGPKAKCHDVRYSGAVGVKADLGRRALNRR
jgi:hypothetical protein